MTKELNIQPELKRNCKQSSEGVLKQGWHIVSTQSCKGVFFLFLFFVGKIWGSKFFICNRLLSFWCPHCDPRKIFPKYHDTFIDV